MRARTREPFSGDSEVEGARLSWEQGRGSHAQVRARTREPERVNHAQVSVRTREPGSASQVGARKREPCSGESEDE